MTLEHTMRTRPHHLLTTLLAVAIAAIAPSARAQDLGVSAPAQSETIAITGATIHTMTGEPIEHGVVVFADGRITYAGPGDGAPSTANAHVIDAAGMHVYPGLIGAYTQLGLTEISAVRAQDDYDEVGPYTPEVRGIVSVNPDSTLIPVARTNGILLAGVFPSGGRMPGRASVIRTDGWTNESISASDDAGLIISWPRMRPNDAWWEDRSERDQRAEARQAIADLDAMFDAAKQYTAERSSNPDRAVDLRLEAIATTLPGDDQYPVFLLANDIDDITTAVSWAGGRGLKPVIVGGRDAPRCAELLKAHGASVIVQGTHNFPKRDDAPYDEAYTLPARLHEAGVPFCIASGAETGHERTLPDAAGRAAGYGLPVVEAERAITRYPAEILGIADDYGTIEVGKSATLIITDGTPLEITTLTHQAFIDGRTIDLGNKQTDLADKYREKYRQLDMIE